MGILFREVDGSWVLEWSQINKAFLRRPQNVEDCANFCGLLRKAELYQSPLVSPVENFQEFWWEFLICFNFSSLFNFVREPNNSKILSELLITKFQSHLVFSCREFWEFISSEFLKNFWRRCLQLWWKIIIKDPVFLSTGNIRCPHYLYHLLVTVTYFLISIEKILLTPFWPW